MTTTSETRPLHVATLDMVMYNRRDSHMRVNVRVAALGLNSLKMLPILPTPILSSTDCID